MTSPLNGFAERKSVQNKLFNVYNLHGVFRYSIELLFLKQCIAYNITYIITITVY